MPLWQTHPQAVAILSRIKPDDLTLDKVSPIVGEPETRIVAYGERAGDLLDKLEKLRRAHVDAEAGCTYLEALRAGSERAEDYRTVEALQPEVWAVLGNLFGAPHPYAPLTDHAKVVWRAEANAALVGREAA